MKTIVVIACVLLMGAGVGCMSLSELVTPATIDRQAVHYVVGAGGDANEYGGYGNLAKARALSGAVDTAHQTIQLSLQQQEQKDDQTYSSLRGVVAGNLTVAQNREESLFGEKGLLSMGLGMLGFGSLTGFIGLMRKRPGDVTPTELDQAVTQATAGSSAEAQAKTTQFTQVVQGVAQFMASIKDAPITLDNLKSIMDKAQDTSTQQAVAAVKATLNV